MGEDIAAANVNRSYLLSGTNIAIFTFMLFFLYPRFESARINPLLFQFTLIAMGVAAFSFVFASLHYYQCSLSGRISEADRTLYGRRADRFWLLGYTMMFLSPSLVLFLVGPPVVYSPPLSRLDGSYLRRADLLRSTVLPREHQCVLQKRSL